MMAVFDVNNSRSRIKITRNIILTLSLYEGVAVAVDNSLTAYGGIIRTVAVNKGKGGLTRYGIAY